MLPRYYTMYHFRSKTNYGFQFDMRHIVLVVGTLTGGPIAGGSILVVLNIYRFLLGGIGVFHRLSVLSFYLLFYYLHINFSIELLIV